MAKTKTPFLSLGSQGTVGGVLTTQKRGSTSILRETPKPTDPYSLAQAYQRWLYEDYAYLWTQQSAATRAAYRSAGSRFHLTGFQYWMKYQLKYLPDIAGWWKLDYSLGAISPDSSRNANSGSIVGASSAPGFISRALHFDGLNDYVDLQNPPSLNITTHLSVEAIIHPLTLHTGLISGKDDPNVTFNAWRLVVHPVGLIYWAVGAGGAVVQIFAPFTPDTTYHVLGTYDGSNVRLYVDGLLAAGPTPLTGPIGLSAFNATFGSSTQFSIGYRFYGILDNPIIYNRALDATEALRHSLRRYPV